MERQATHSLGNGDVLRVVSVPQSARVWLDALASALKMTRSGLAERLETVPCLLPLPPEVDAARLRGYMRVLGVQVDDAPQGHADVHDLSIYVKEGVDPATAVGSIGAVLRSVLPQHTLDLTGLLAGSRSAMDHGRVDFLNPRAGPEQGRKRGKEWQDHARRQRLWGYRPWAGWPVRMSCSRSSSAPPAHRRKRSRRGRVRQSFWARCWISS